MRDKPISQERSAARLTGLSLSLGAAAALLSTAFCGQAQAVDPSTIPGYQGARQVLHTAQVHNAVSQFLSAAANVGADGGSGSATPMASRTQDDQQAFSLNDPVALYELAPDFVTGKEKPTPGNVARLSYLASVANGANGHTATVLLSSAARSDGGSWHLAGVRDGNSDVTYGQQSSGHSMVFTEPQIHAWYRLNDNTVEPLNQEATSGLHGKQAVTLAAYQKLVHNRYADKLPGSAYDGKGLAGGYGLASTPSSPSPAPLRLAGSAAVAVALAGGAIAAWRGKRKRRRQVDGPR
jgi:hypothetical protein